MGSYTRKKNASKWKGMAIFLLLIVIASGIFGAYKYSVSGDKDATTTIDPETGEEVLLGEWVGKVVNLKLNTYDKYSSADESATAKVYEKEPVDWENPRGDFSDAKLYTSYTASSGVVTINKQYPGHYYVVVTVSGSNTEFVEIDIPDGSSESDSLADYNSAPYTVNVPISAVGSTTDVNFAFTLTNGTQEDETSTINLQIADSTELRGLKVVINDEEGFSIDNDDTGAYDEGIRSFKVTVCGQSKIIFKPAIGIDLFDSDDKYSLDLVNCNLEDGDQLTIKVEINADTGDYIGANDAIWGEGEGVLSYIKVYDKEGTLFSTSDVTA